MSLLFILSLDYLFLQQWAAVSLSLYRTNVTAAEISQFFFHVSVFYLVAIIFGLVYTFCIRESNLLSDSWTLYYKNLHLIVWIFQEGGRCSQNWIRFVGVQNYLPYMLPYFVWLFLDVTSRKKKIWCFALTYIQRNVSVLLNCYKLGNLKKVCKHKKRKRKIHLFFILAWSK